MSKNSNNSTGGIGVFTVVGVVFIVLKLLHVEPVNSWSWLWVLAPFWIGAALLLLVVLIAFIAVKVLDR